ncbi:MAG: DUF262 domain-containing protein [bacterium]
MKANKLWMLKDFLNTNKVLFKIPVYQRNYDWSESNCNRLLLDIKNVIETNNKHFIGAVVYMSDDTNSVSLNEYIIIDGQQRITTMMLVLKALCDVSLDLINELNLKDDKIEEDIKLLNETDVVYGDIDEDYLHNKRCDEKFKIKLKPIKTDNEQFDLLLKNKYEQLNKESHIYLNYNFCKEKFILWIKQGITPKQIYNALEKLEVVEIVLQKGEDDPQVIFESINSTGLDLTNSDLIRNFLLMNEEDQDRLFEDYWCNIERNLKRSHSYNDMDNFFNNYVIYKTSSPTNLRQLYNKFVDLSKEISNEEILKELNQLSKYYKLFIYGCDTYSKKINSSLTKLRLLNQTTCYPFLLHLFNDFNNNVITEEEVNKVLEFLVSYLLRRIVCGVPSNSLRGLFIYLYCRVFKVKENKKHYSDTIITYFMNTVSKDSIPNDSEFKSSLINSNIYQNSALCKFLLCDIENGDSKEVLDFSNLTIEHIMPQTLSIDWSHIDNEYHTNYLHTLGNLSITGYNSELSNKKFSEKKEIIIANSKANVLNSDVINQEVWNEESINNRANRLSKIILDRYNINYVDNNKISFEYTKEILFSEEVEVTGKKLVSFKFYDQIYKQNKFSLMLVDAFKILLTKHEGKLREFAEDGYSMNVQYKHTHLSTNIVDLRKPKEVGSGICIETHLNADSCCWFITSILRDLNEDASKFSLFVVDEEEMDE